MIRAAAEAVGGQDLEQVAMRWGFIPGSQKGPIKEFMIRSRKRGGLTNCRDPRDGRRPSQLLLPLGRQGAPLLGAGRRLL